MSRDNLEKKIDDMEYTLFDRFVYGGLGYGTFCLPTNLMRVVATIVFPPLAIVFDWLEGDFPFINFEKMVRGIDKFFYSLVLTMMFYIPGLIYSLSHINVNSGFFEEVEEIEEDIEERL
jgi:uncharacterized membrane protein YqaE (UPF0057 family)